MSDPDTAAGFFAQRGAAHRRRPLIFHALVVLTLAAPLPLGAYEAWAWAIGATVCGALVLGWGVSALASRTPAVIPPPFLRWSAAALTLAVLWALLQTVGFTPESWHHPLWRDTAEALDLPYRGAISLNPAAGRESVLRIASYAGVFWLAFQYGRTPGRASHVLRALAIGSACYALYGLAVVFSGAELILWFEKEFYVDEVTATFVNPNSFATYCGIGLLCATAVLRRRFDRGAPKMPDVRQRLYFLIVEFLPANALFLAAWLVLATALLLSLSRGGVAAAALGLLAFLWIVPARRNVRLRTRALRSIGLVLAGAVLLLLIGQGLERRLWETGPDWAKRSQIYSQTVQAIEDEPLLGTGLGTFAPVYRSYRTHGIRRGVRMAHNDYLELALELGIPAAVLFVASIAALALGCARGAFARRRGGVFPAAGAAVCTLVGAHALVDFSLQIPAVAVTFALILGVAVAQAAPPRKGRRNTQSPVRQRTARSRARARDRQ